MVLNTLKQYLCSSLYIDYMISEEFYQHLDIVHAKYHHAPGKLALNIHELVDLEHVLGDLVLIELEQVPVVGLHVPGLLGLLLWIHAKKVAKVAHSVVALVCWRGDFPLTIRHYAIEDVLSQLKVLLAVGAKVELLG